MYKKYKRRYGKFPVLEPIAIITLIILAVFIFSGYTAERIKGTFFYISFWIIYFIYAYSPFVEKFRVQKNIIYIKKFVNKKIIIPDDAVFIISSAKIGNFFPKKVCIVNIVANSVDVVLEKLSREDITYERNFYRHILKKGCIYDDWCVEERLENNFIYSFAYDEETTQEMFNNLKKNIVLPRSLKSKITIKENDFAVVIYEGK